MKFQELTDRQWNMIKQHVPPHARTGRPRDDDRKIFNGIIYLRSNHRVQVGRHTKKKSTATIPLQTGD